MIGEIEKMTKIAVFTPVHVFQSEYLLEAYRSLCRQTLSEWHWYILPNGHVSGYTAAVQEEIRKDDRVTVMSGLGLSNVSIGALKKELCDTAKEAYLVELDYDDLLEPAALHEILFAFEEKGADFVYSDFAEFKVENGKRVANKPYSSAFGWRSYPYQDSDDNTLQAMRAAQLTPQNLRLVDWSPNHVRAFRKEMYTQIGGHDATLTFADDHDLIVRLYLAGVVFVHLPGCLYLYRVHDSNTVKTRNADIRKSTWQVYNKYITQLAEKFARDTDTLCVDLCGGPTPYRGYLSLDANLRAAPGFLAVPPGTPRVIRHESRGTLPYRRESLRDASGIECDLNESWPLADNSVGLLRAVDALEHLKNPIHTMNEAYRVLRPGGFFLTSTPSSSGKGAFCDPTHVSFWNDLSARYYANEDFAKYVPAYQGRFHVAKNVEHFLTDWHRTNNVPYVETHYIKLGENYEPMGKVLWPTRLG